MLADVVAELTLAVGGFVATNVESVEILVGVFCANSDNASAIRSVFAADSFVLLIVSLSILGFAVWA